MPIYIKRIRGREYYYEQHSEYRPGRSPRSVMRYIGPVQPKRKSALAGFIEANFKPDYPGEWAVARMEAQYPAPESEPRRAPVDPVPIDKPAPTIDLQATSAAASAEVSEEVRAEGKSEV